MKNKLILLSVLLLMSRMASAQIGIGTASPDVSSILELKSNEKGFLPPRMTTTERNLITPAATGLLIYNTETAAFNFFDGTVWKDMAPASLGANSISFSADATAEASTTSKIEELVPGMSIIPGAGKYLVSFNGQYNSAPFTYDVNITNQAVLDLSEMYANLTAKTTTVTDHAGVFGNGESLLPGVYSFAAASTISGNLFLNAQGRPDAVFIFKLGAAFTSGANAKVILSNAASACNVFWVADGAISMGAGTEMKGTLLSNNGSVSMARGCSLEGRMFSTTGAVSFEKATINAPIDCSYIDIGVLSSFALYTVLGAVTAEPTSVSTVRGDIGSNLGLISGFIPEINTNTTVFGNIYGPNSPLVTIDKNVLSTFSIFENGVLVPNSNRTRRSKAPTTDVVLQAIATVLDGQAIEVRWKTDVSVLKMNNRIITIVKTQ